MEEWTEKTVSMDNVDTEEFDTDLAHVTVSENRIHVAFKEHDDWKRIRREVGDDTILREVEWRDVVDVDTTTEHLYYLHIDVSVDHGGEDGAVEKRLYFTEDDEDALEDCVAAIRRYWNAWRQKQSAPAGDYSYGEAGEASGETGDDVDLAAATGEAADDEEDESGPEDTDSDEAEDDGAEDEAEDDRGIEDIVKDFLP